jgi:hypothetical protein
MFFTPYSVCDGQWRCERENNVVTDFISASEASYVRFKTLASGPPATLYCTCTVLDRHTPIKSLLVVCRIILELQYGVVCAESAFRLGWP